MTWVKIPPSEWLDSEQLIQSGFGYLHEHKQQGIAYDTETTGTTNFKDFPLICSFSDGVRRFACEADWLDHPLVKDLVTGDCPKIGSNFKFDMHMTANIGVNIGGPIWDTIVMDFLLDENRTGRHGLKEISRDYCDIMMREFKEVFPMFKKRKGHPIDTAGDAIRRKMSTAEGRKDAIEYAGLDAYANHIVFQYLRDRLKAILIYEGVSLWDLFVAIEAPFTRVLWNLERRGVTICSGYFKQQEVPMEKAIGEIEAQFNQAAGRMINLKSPPQLREFFYTNLGKTPEKWTKGGDTGNKQPSTEGEVLQGWADEGCQFSKIILEYRKITKAYDTYVAGLSELLDNDFRLHTTLNQIGAVTGRLSSREPNLQNIPNPSKDRFRLRDGFVASYMKRLIVADYAQLEMLILAHKSEDPVMVEAIIDGKDLHCLAVSLIFGFPYDEVVAAKKAEKKGHKLTETQRRLLDLRQAMKAVGYGIVYGIGPDKLGHDLTEEFQKTDKLRVVTKAEAEDYINAWFGLFKVVKQFINSQKTFVRQNGYVQTFLRRFRRLPEVKSSRYKDKLKAERQAVNIIQGDAADIVKIAMIAVEQDERLRELSYRQLLQIHDEIVGEADDEDEKVNACKVIVKDIMENSFNRNIFKLRVPLIAEINDGYSWASAK